jgi:DNA-binding MarR family transcriptional regulator
MSLLGRKKGAGIEELIAATGWLPHTTRAALTGLRKRGFAIERSRNEQGTLYRIVTGTAPALAA